MRKASVSEAIEVTGNGVDDGQALPDLRAQLPEDETIVTVGGDGASTPEAAKRPSMRAAAPRSLQRQDLDPGRPRRRGQQRDGARDETTG